jgi:uncharacterized protein YecE (DUF72 family)
MARADMATPIRIGTCSFADEALVKAWYPKEVKTGEQRLRHYAEHFDTVEIDSTFYRMQPPETVAKWAERVPDGFVFHVKAFGALTRHPVKLEALPEDVQQRAEANERGRVDYLPRDLRAEVFGHFREMIAPFREAGKMGGILFQMPPFFVFRARSLEYLEWAQEQLEGERLLVEFRHRSWMDDEHRAETLSFLEQRRLTNVIVDAPRSEAKNLIPTVVALTSPLTYVRMHGRNAKTWNVRGGSAADRFDYLYDEDELREWVDPLRELAGKAEEVYVVFNTNARSPSPRGEGEIAQGAENAYRLTRVLAEAGLPATPATPSPGS